MSLNNTSILFTVMILGLGILIISSISFLEPIESFAIVYTVNTESWEEEVLQSQLPVFVYFWSEWCGPCTLAGKEVYKLSRSMDEVKIVKLNVDENQEIAVKYGIHVVPSFLLFKDGKKIVKTEGAWLKEQYQKFIENHLARN